MILEKILEERIRFRYEKAEHEYIQIVSEWFAYVILTRCRKIVDHKYDPPWDCSGNIINTDGKFSLDDYPALLDFVENEYSGNSRPSFISGCGIFYNTYSDELDDITRDWIVYQLEYIIKELIEEENVQLKDWLLTLDEIINFDIENTLDISQEILCEDIISDFTFSEFPYEIMESILCMDPKLLFKRGKDTA
ncbi:MAG TPA: hypothetical protein VFD57_06425, partial [Clostridia bacterium]|nr:hypothetical protein [Clostridia bacterium]